MSIVEESAPPVDRPASTPVKDIWDKVDIVGKLLGAIFIPLTVVLAGFFINNALQDRSASQKTFEIAVGILQAPTGATPALKSWAQGVFEAGAAKANQPLPQKAIDELQRNPLPAGSQVADLITEFEGFSATPQESGGQWYIGFGHTEGVGPSTPPVTVETALSLLQADLLKVGERINKVVRVPLNSNQREALAAFVWNVGKENFENSTLLSKLNEGKYEEVPTEMLRWSKQQGALSPGLTRRRQREIDLWNTSPPQ